MTRRCPWKKSRPAAPPPPPSSFVRGEHEFRIVGFSAAGEVHNSVLSGTFQVGGHTWALECGFDEPGHLASVFLELLTPYVTGDLVVAKAGLRIEDPLGRCPAAVWRSEKAYTFNVSSGENCSRTWKLSVPDEFRAHESRYVQHDRLTILCTVEVLRLLEGDDSSTTVADDIYKLLSLPSQPESKSESERKRRACMMPDVTFVVEETEVQAHRLVLAARSPVFAAELLGDMREGTARRVRVGDMRASAFRAMIRFIYTDKMPIKEAKTDDEASAGSKAKCAARRRVAMACELLAAADRYDLEKLRIMCEELLSESMDADSVMPTLMAVDGRHSCRRLEASCIEYLACDADVYAAVKATDDYMELQESCNSFLVEVMDKVATHKSAANSSDSDTATNKPQHPNNSSVSTYDTSKVASTHEMRIPNFVKVKRARIKANRSDTFRVDGYDWKLLVYLRKKNTAEEHVSVYIELLTDPGTAGVRASVCFRMKDPNGTNYAPIQRKFERIFTRKTPAIGYPNFIAMKHAKVYLAQHDGSLTVQCHITVANMMTCNAHSDTSAGVVRAPTLAPPLNIARHLEELLASGKGSDVKFLVEKREIRAHKLVIAARSPVVCEVVVAAVAANKEDDIIVPVNDMKAAVFEAVLHFIYTGELPPMEDSMALASEDGVLIVGDLLAAACRFRLDTMKAKCETLLAESISKENALTTLKLARQHNLLKLEDYCDLFISSEYVARYRYVK